MGDRSPAAPSALTLAARHPLNVTMLGALGVSALLTGSWLPLIVAAVVEAGWLISGPRLESTRDLIRWQQERSLQRAQMGAEQALLRQTSEADRRRFLELDQVRRDIHRLVEGHDSLSLEMMRGELHKVDRLLDAYLRVAVTTHAQERILAEDPGAAPKALPAGAAAPKEGASALDASAPGPKDDLRDARTAQRAELVEVVAQARQQLDRVAAQLRLVRDRVATMRTPEDLAGPLDDLVETVEVVEASGRETERLARGLIQSQRI